MPVSTEPEPEDIDEDAPSRSALRIIDTLSTSLPPAQVFPALRQLITQYMAQPDPNAHLTNMFSLVERFTFCPSPTESSLLSPSPFLPPEIQYWAGVIMRVERTGVMVG